MRTEDDNPGEDQEWSGKGGPHQHKVDRKGEVFRKKVHDEGNEQREVKPIVSIQFYKEMTVVRSGAQVQLFFWPNQYSN